MAQVFEAVAVGAEGFERRVALKQILADHRADASARRSFFDEARLASALHHGGLVAVLDYGAADGVPFQVLELVDGRDARVLADAGLARGRPCPRASRSTSAARSRTRFTMPTRRATDPGSGSRSSIATSSRATSSCRGRAT